jgi:hypothetical protein
MRWSGKCVPGMLLYEIGIELDYGAMERKRVMRMSEWGWRGQRY